MKAVRLATLLEILNAHAGAVIVTALTRTQPRLLVRSRATGQPTVERFPFGVEKLAFGRFILAARYERNVRAQRTREGHPDPRGFVDEPLWAGKGKRLGRFVARHEPSGRLYLVARPESDQRGRPVKLRETWIRLHDGAAVEGEELVDLVENFLVDRPRPARKQELRREVPYRVYDLGHLVALRVDGVTYQLEPDACPFALPANP